MLGADTHAVRAALQEGVRASLLEQTESGWRFIHNRVQEAFLARLDDSAKRRLHQTIADDLAETPDKTPEQLHAWAHHALEGSPKDHPQSVYRACRAAGELALSRFSADQAVHLLSEALDIAGEAGVGREAIAAVRESLGVALAFTGEHERAQAHFDAIIRETTDETVLARLQYRKALAHMGAGRMRESWTALQEALDALGEGFPKDRESIVADIAAYQQRYAQIARSGEGFGGATGDERARRVMLSDIYTTARFAVLFMDDHASAGLASLRDLYNSHFLGVSIPGAKAHAWFSFVMAFKTKDLAIVERHGEAAVAMARQLGNPETLAMCEWLYGGAVEATGAISRGQEMVRNVVERIAKYASAWNIASSHQFLALSMMFQGESRKCVDWLLHALPMVVRTNSLNFICGLWSILYSQFTLLGRDLDALNARAEMLAVAEKLPHSKHATAYVHGAEIMVLVNREDFGPDLERHIETYVGNGMKDYHRRYVYFLIAYARLEQLRRATDDRDAALARFRAAVDACRPLTEVPVHRCHLLALDGVLAREEGGDGERARALFNQAEETARETDCEWALWVLARERARTAADAGDGEAASIAARKAWLIARNQGWQRRAGRISAELDVEETVPTGRASASASRSMTISRDVTAIERYSDALLRVSLASASTLDPLAQGRAALDELIRVLGAERAFLFRIKESGGEPVFQVGRDNRGANLGARSSYARSIVSRVLESRRALVVTGTEEGQALGSMSAVAQNLRSIIAAPVLLQDRLVGLVYLDSSVVKGLFSRDDVEILQAICNHVAVAFEMARIARLEVLEKELELTAAVQAFFLPQRHALTTRSFTLDTLYLPAERCSGDWWSYRETLGGLEVLVADATGHGSPAATLTAAVAGAYQSIRRRGPDLDLETILNELNQDFSALTSDRHGMTAAAVSLAEDGRVTFCTAGAPPGLILRADGSVDVLSRPSSPSGRRTNSSSARIEQQLRPKDRLILYTDGLPEFELAAGRPFGLRRISRLLTKTRGMDIPRALRVFADSLDLEQRNEPQDDDITLTMIDMIDAS